MLSSIMKVEAHVFLTVMNSLYVIDIYWRSFMHAFHFLSFLIVFSGLRTST
jgi:hypothetical protein